MKPSILYALSSWSGPRSYISFDDTYLQRHISQLKSIKHNLSQIVIGNPENPSKRQEFDEYIKSITDINGTPVIVHDFPNISRSYGQWARIYEKYRTQFDYYIFCEDDYVPVIDDFDSILVDMYEESKCGFLCGLILDSSGRYGRKELEKHAGVSNGIASSKVLESVRERFCCLPHDMGEYAKGQILFSKGFIDSGFELSEYISTGEYRCLYFEHTNNIRIYGPNRNGKDIFSPSQIIDKEKQFNYTHYVEKSRPVSGVVSNPIKHRVIGRRR